MAARHPRSPLLLAAAGLAAYCFFSRRSPWAVSLTVLRAASAVVAALGSAGAPPASHADSLASALANATTSYDEARRDERVGWRRCLDGSIGR